MNKLIAGITQGTLGQAKKVPAVVNSLYSAWRGTTTPAAGSQMPTAAAAQAAPTAGSQMPTRRQRTLLCSGRRSWVAAQNAVTSMRLRNSYSPQNSGWSGRESVRPSTRATWMATRAWRATTIRMRSCRGWQRNSIRMKTVGLGRAASRAMPLSRRSRLWCYACGTSRKGKCAPNCASPPPSKSLIRLASSESTCASAAGIHQTRTASCSPTYSARSSRGACGRL
ncbi:hypothetical protein T492DRAFT_358345 [Pavlovales sp. CCMP2436]|nr:hypothetical protein T492DRAFT_358345 [Pavlovales sp. CCMP2436]